MAPTPPPAQTASPAAPAAPTITISAAGFTPQEVTIAIGARVLFVNGDRTGHEISSGLDHNSRDCAEIDVVGFLVAGQSRETAPFAQSKTCRFHDHAQVGVAAYQGRIVAQ
jgi:plastocyanin